MDFSKDKKDKVQYISKIAVPLLSVIALLNLSIIAFAPEAVMFFAPKSYYEAIWIIPSVAMSVYFMFMYSLLKYRILF